MASSSSKSNFRSFYTLAAYTKKDYSKFQIKGSPHKNVLPYLGLSSRKGQKYKMILMKICNFSLVLAFKYSMQLFTGSALH